jgi:hypothetical protein
VSESFPQSRLRGPRTETEGPACLRIATEVCDAGQIAQSLGPRETRHPSHKGRGDVPARRADPGDPLRDVESLNQAVRWPRDDINLV